MPPCPPEGASHAEAGEGLAAPPRRRLAAFARRPVRSLLRAAARLRDVTLYPALLRLQPGVRCEGTVLLRGWPLIEVEPDASVVLGNGVLLNSSNASYHINMHSPVKLVADVPGAVIRIGAGTRLHGTCVHAYRSVSIGRNCLIAANTQIMDGSGHDLSFDDPSRRSRTRGNARPVVIEDDVWIGANTLVLPGVSIGRGCVVAAGSVVANSIPAMSLAGGNPARVLREYGTAADPGPPGGPSPGRGPTLP